MKLASSKDTSDDRAVAQRTRSIANSAFASAVAILAVVAVPKSRAQTAPASPAGGVPAAARAASTIHQDMCAACHAGNGTGGPGGAANLIRSPIAMADDGGKTLGQFLQVGRPEKGMPPFPQQSQQATQLSVVLRLLAQDVAPGGRTASAAARSSILVGDAEAGKRFFEGDVGKCSSCHAVQAGAAGTASNLAGTASRYPDPKTLQNRMVLNRSFFWSPSLGEDVTATVTYRDGRVVAWGGQDDADRAEGRRAESNADRQAPTSSRPARPLPGQ
ncbi:c-type cytochrome [uncultured Sphingomonas sp.]|uniref:c-type cytochrome n=1 Tax=uncultured Sphingomonas sp. TaxID=158754 RepID=UPI0025E70E94|nr:c-type cytochrome [uncultured Sphingomonas sp.]